MKPSVWIPGPRRSGATVRAVMFPFAGAGANALRGLGENLPGWVDPCAVELPGRWTRAREPLSTRVEPLIDAALDGLRAVLVPPYVLVGYSLGGLLAFELARALARQGRPGPIGLVVAARRPPHLPGRPPTHHLPDDAFLDRLDADYGGVPPALRTNAMLRSMFLPVMKADMAVLESHVWRPGAPLDTPILAVRGARDPSVDDGAVRAWAQHTTRGLAVATLPGGHFFVQDDPTALADAIAEHVEQWAR